MKASPIIFDGISERKRLDVVRAVLTSEGISRNKIAEECGISKVTVGKMISVMLSEGFLVSEKQSLGKGRSTEIFRASSKINILVLCLEKRGLSAVISDIGGNILFSHRQPINDSIPYSSNISDLITLLYDRISLAVKGHICGIAVITEDGISSSDIQAASLVIPEFTADIVLHRRKYVADYISSTYPNEAVLLARIDASIEFALVCSGIDIGSRKAGCLALESIDEKRIVEQITDTLSALSHLLVPDRVMIESERICVTGDLVSALRNSFKQKSRVDDNDMPLFAMGGDTPIAVKAAIKRTADMLIDTLAGVTNKT